jgi:alpha-tubulin suppressor-like RCC1 family protein
MRWFAAATATLLALGCNSSVSSGSSGAGSQDSDIVVARSSDAGLTWSSPSAINAGASSDTWGDWEPQLATDAQGQWLAVWQSSSLTDIATALPDLDILSTGSMDNGLTWAGQTPVNTDATTDMGPDFSASVATDHLGTWIAVWVSADTLGGTIGDDNDLLYARSTDNGATWSPPAALNATAPTDFSPAGTEAAFNGEAVIASAVATGFDHSCALRADTGDVVCWGDDRSGQSTPPDSVNGVSGTATAIASGGSHSCAIQTGSDSVVCWGANGSGQATPPDAVNGVSGTAAAIAAGGSHSCAIQTGSGSVVCWGANGSGQATPPSAVNGVSGSAAAIAAGDSHSCAIQTGTNNVVCWGANGSGQATPPSAVNGVSGSAAAIASGGSHSCAIQTGSDSVVCWGANGSGQATPPNAVNGVSGTAIAISAGDDHSCALQTDAMQPGAGAVVCWGNPIYGKTTPPKSVDGTPIAGTSIVQTATAVAAGGSHSCAIDAQAPKALVCWGNDSYNTDWEPQVATDGLGYWVVVWSSNNSLGDSIGKDYDILEARSMDDGLSWSDPSPVNSNAATDEVSGSSIAGDRFPSLATDGQGAWIVTWTAVNSPGDPKPPPPKNNSYPANDDLFFARSLDAGATWSARARLNTDGGSDSTTDRASRVATDQTGNWVAVWSSIGSRDTPLGADGDIMTARSSDGGLSWTPPVPLNSNAATDTGTDATPQVTFGSGSFIATWSSAESFGGTLGPDTDILLARSTDLGASWTDPAALNTNAASDEDEDLFPQLTTDGMGNWIAIWQSGNPL